MNADEARTLVAKAKALEEASLKAEYFRIIESIKKAATQGKESLTIAGYLNKIIGDKMARDGFKIIHASQKDEAYTEISWK